MDAIHTALVAAHRDGGPTAISGYVREQTFRHLVLPSVPPQFRVCTGQIIDQYGSASGQLDAIIGNGHFPSVPAPAIHDVRIVLAEGASSVVEVKSSLPSQWRQVCDTRDRLAGIRRRYRSGGAAMGLIGERVPLYVVAYKGWRTVDTVRAKLDEVIAGILVLQPKPVFTGRIYDEVVTGTEMNALWAFMCGLHFRASQIIYASADLFAYGRGITEP